MNKQLLSVNNECSDIRVPTFDLWNYEEHTLTHDVISKANEHCGNKICFKMNDDAQVPTCRLRDYREHALTHNVNSKKASERSSEQMSSKMSAVYAKRYEAVFLCMHPKGPKLSYADAAKVLKMSKKFVLKWVHRYAQTKNVDDFPERGKTDTMSSKQDKVILQLFEDNPTLPLREAKAKLAEKGINISINSIRQHLRAIITLYRSMKPLLSEAQMQKRMAWATKNINRDWSKVIFSDEATFRVCVQIKRSAHGTNIFQSIVKHPIKVNVWGCFSDRGFGCLELFTKNLNAEKMVQIYKRGLLRSANKMFGSNIKDWVLQEDDDPKHSNSLCRAWKEQNGIVTIDWPSQSPDASPIENVWALMRTKLARKPVYNLEQLSKMLRRIWCSLSTDYAQKLVKSMPIRCQNILDYCGDFTVY